MGLWCDSVIRKEFPRAWCHPVTTGNDPWKLVKTLFFWKPSSSISESVPHDLTADHLGRSQEYAEIDGWI